MSKRKTMPQADIETCLGLLNQADEMLMSANELALAAHLSLVIERLSERLPGYVPVEFA